MGFTCLCFIITPDELREMIEPITLFISNTHVPVDYRFTSDDEFIQNYTEVISRLKNGEKIDKHNDYMHLKHYSYTTDISSIHFGDQHIYEGKEYKSFQESDRGFPPYFSPFAVMMSVEEDKVYFSTRVSTSMGDIIGYELVFPDKYEAAHYGLESEKDWKSFEDYRLCSDFIKNYTSPLKFSVDDIVKKTTIRVSDDAKKTLPDYDFVKKHKLTIL